ncbi:MAG: hypothetical protein RL363_403 [Bacteroidota bacterium]|jgi:hypothetical protein
MEISLLELEKLSTSQLEDFINECIKSDFSRLVQLLYRIDVSEQKLKTILLANPNEDAGKLIASVIVERLAATKEARESFSNQNPKLQSSEDSRTENNNTAFNSDDEGAERL